MTDFIIGLGIGKYISLVDTPKFAPKKADKSATNVTGSLAHAVMSIKKNIRAWCRSRLYIDLPYILFGQGENKFILGGINFGRLTEIFITPRI